MGAGGDWDVIHYFLGKSQEQILSLLDSSFIRNNTGIDPAPIARYKLHT